MVGADAAVRCPTTCIIVETIGILSTGQTYCGTCIVTEQHLSQAWHIPTAGLQPYAHLSMYSPLSMFACHYLEGCTKGEVSAAKPVMPRILVCLAA